MSAPLIRSSQNEGRTQTAKWLAYLIFLYKPLTQFVQSSQQTAPDSSGPHWTVFEPHPPRDISGTDFR